MTNETHEPSLRSWVPSANIPDTDFPIQNLPFGVFRRRGTSETKRIGVAIGDHILDLFGCKNAGLLDDLLAGVREAASHQSLNSLMSLGPAAASRFRERVSRILRADSVAREDLLVPMPEAELSLPAVIGDYTDFYASIYHASNVGRLFRPSSPLLPNYKHVPIAYGGRSSSIVVSGTEVRRPRGQTKPQGEEAPVYVPTARLDYEMEVGAFIGPSGRQGSPIRIEDAEAHILGLCLLNDWSTRDIQVWEAQPLGPFLAKNFATTISPWVVTLEALEPFRAAALVRSPGDPEPLPYLSSQRDREQGGFDITVEVFLQTSKMRQERFAPARLSRGSVRSMYWTFAQMVAHHTSNGCNLRSGDLLGSGTVSGPTPESLGCLLELTNGGTQAVDLPNGETRRFLEDGDEVIFRAFCERQGYVRIGFGECRGTILACDEPK